MSCFCIVLFIKNKTVYLFIFFFTALYRCVLYCAPSTDHWQQYIVAVTNLQQRRWERLSEHLVREVQLENVWISLRMSNRGRDRPDQTPRVGDRGSRTPGQRDPLYLFFNVLSISQGNVQGSNREKIKTKLR